MLESLTGVPCIVAFVVVVLACVLVWAKHKEATLRQQMEIVKAQADMAEREAKLASDMAKKGYVQQTRVVGSGLRNGSIEPITVTEWVPATVETALLVSPAYASTTVQFSPTEPTKET